MVGSVACSRCLLSTDVPGVQLEEGAVCSVCREHDRLWTDWNEAKEERLAALKKTLDRARKKKRIYDVVVPLSGGKDSTYALYLCRRRFDLKCLAVTFDNGFLSEYARENARNACDILGADHMYYGLNRQVLMYLYRFFFLKTGFFCPVCMRGIQVAISRAQIAFDVPLAIRGTSRRTEEHVAPEFFLPGNPSFLENVLEGSPLQERSSVLLHPVGFASSPPEIELPAYVEWDHKEIYKTIAGELGWKAHTADAEHSDCRVHNIVSYIRYSKFPALVPELLRFSKLVTAGQMTREEAERRVSENKDSIGEPDNLAWFLGALGISREEMDGVLADPLRHMKYTKERSRAWRRLRALRHRRPVLP